MNERCRPCGEGGAEPDPFIEGVSEADRRSARRSAPWPPRVRAAVKGKEHTVCQHQVEWNWQCPCPRKWLSKRRSCQPRCRERLPGGPSCEHPVLKQHQLFSFFPSFHLTMRTNRCLLFLALLAVLALPGLASLMAVDLGGNFLKVSVVQPGQKPISIAENEMSRRQTPVIVGFVDNQRVLGEDAVTVSGRHPDKFVEHLRDLIGRRADDPAVAELLTANFRGYDIVPDEARGTIQMRVPGNDHLFSIEELMVCPHHLQHTVLLVLQSVCAAF